MDDNIYYKSHDLDKPITDEITPYGKGEAPKIDPITDWGKGIRFYTCDGKEVESMDVVMQYNQMYYERMMMRDKNLFEENSGRHR